MINGQIHVAYVTRTNIMTHFTQSRDLAILVVYFRFCEFFLVHHVEQTRLQMALANRNQSEV